MKLHRDIYTEPSKVDPNTLANLGPLRPLAGVWQSTKGIDLNPKADGPEQREFVERVEMLPIDPQTNGPQLLYGLRYHIHINTPEEQITFHDQVGYWLWEPATGLVMQTIAIPRGQTVLAAGQAKPDDKVISVSAKLGEEIYGICSTTFLDQAFRTTSYKLDITIHDDNSWSYAQHSVMAIEGDAAPFDHHDSNTLCRIAAPTPNPLAQILAREKSTT